MYIRKSHSGFTLIELLIVVLVAVASIGAFMRLQTGAHNDSLADAMGTHAAVAGRASASYLADNRGALLAAAGPTAPVVVTAAQLAAGKYTDVGYNAVNSFGQRLEMRVIEPTPGTLEAIIVGVGGDAMDGGTAIATARAAGEAGGYIAASSPTVAQGALGGWSIPLAPYGAVGVGQVVVNVSLIEAAAP